MADQNGEIFESPPLSGVTAFPQILGSVYIPPVEGTITMFFYRTVAGVRGSTSDTSLIPVGAIIERIK